MPFLQKAPPNAVSNVWRCKFAFSPQMPMSLNDIDFSLRQLFCLKTFPCSADGCNRPRCHRHRDRYCQDRRHMCWGYSTACRRFRRPVWFPSRSALQTSFHADFFHLYGFYNNLRFCRHIAWELIRTNSNPRPPGRKRSH